MIFATGNYYKFQMIKMTSIVPLILRPHKTESPWINVSIIINVSFITFLQPFIAPTSTPLHRRPTILLFFARPCAWVCLQAETRDSHDQ